MDRRRALGIGLVLLSAFGFGSGSLFAKPAYDEKHFKQLKRF